MMNKEEEHPFYPEEYPVEDGDMVEGPKGQIPNIVHRELIDLGLYEEENLIGDEMSEFVALEPKKGAAITALLEHRTVEEASVSVDVSSRTLYRWMNEPIFQAELRKAESELVDTAMRRLLRLSTKAIDALEDIIDNPDQSGASNKRMASQMVIDNLLKLRELNSIEQRLGNLERVMHP